MIERSWVPLPLPLNYFIKCQLNQKMKRTLGVLPGVIGGLLIRQKPGLLATHQRSMRTQVPWLVKFFVTGDAATQRRRGSGWGRPSRPFRLLRRGGAHPRQAQGCHGHHSRTSQVCQAGQSKVTISFDSFRVIIWRPYTIICSRAMNPKGFQSLYCSGP